MFNKITIPNPCHENWDEMLPESQGKHCLVCQKTVVDFTGWEPAAISGYLKEKAGQKLCGRFKTSQLEQSAEISHTDWIKHIAQSGMSFIKKIAAVVIIVFGVSASSCNDDKAATGDVRPATDTIESVPQQTMGIVLMPADTAVNGHHDPRTDKGIGKKKVCPPQISADTIPDPIIVGELAPLPQDSLSY